MASSIIATQTTTNKSGEASSVMQQNIFPTCTVQRFMYFTGPDIHLLQTETHYVYFKCLIFSNMIFFNRHYVPSNKQTRYATQRSRALLQKLTFRLVELFSILYGIQSYIIPKVQHWYKTNIMSFRYNRTSSI